MRSWGSRSLEERALLNPSFSALVIWNAVVGYAKENGLSFPIELAFLTLPIVLHRPTRDALPARTATSLAVWLAEQPTVKAKIAIRARVLVPFTREALIFGGSQRLYILDNGKLSENQEIKRNYKNHIGRTTSEINECMTKSEFLGRWFSKSSSPETVMALFGVRP